MKRFAVIIILCLVCVKVNATTPFAPKVFENNSWVFIAGFAWPDENDKVLIIRTVRKTTLLSLEELGISKLEEGWTTAGFRWYHNSIGYVAWIKLKDSEPDSRLRVFYFVNRKGKESIVDLATNKLVDSQTILNKAELDQKTVLKAVDLLKSDNPQDRQTAAIHLGGLGTSEHLPLLKNLLKDKSARTHISGNKKETVYYVKEVAEKAIESIKSRAAADKVIDSDNK